MKPLSVTSFLEKSSVLPVLDVRSPSEHKEAHIPGAISFPLFSDEERARVGTSYKQEGKDQAVLLGLEIVGPRMSDMMRSALELAPGRQVLVHCWRGGMRSESVAWLLEKAGFTCFTLQGGYKAFRNHVLQSFERPLPVVILGGSTGSGKTAILQHLHRMGEQVLDLEGLAGHKGSAFGNLTGEQQPTTEQFHTLLYTHWHTFTPDRPVWIEDESFSIGSVRLPYPLWDQMKAAPCLAPDMPLSFRVRNLVEDYGQYDIELLAEACGRIRRKLGDLRYRQVTDDLQQGNLEGVAENLLQYYDKTYKKGLDKRPEVVSIPVDTRDPAANARAMQQAWHTYEHIHKAL